jgi:hypothetical protein
LFKEVIVEDEAETNQYNSRDNFNSRMSANSKQMMQKKQMTSLYGA